MGVYHAAALFVVPTVVLVLAFVAGLLITRWLAKRIGEPFVAKHIAMMERLSVAYVAITELLEKITEQNKRDEKRHEDNVNRLEEIVSRLDGVCRYPGDGRRKTPTTLPGAIAETKG